MRVGLARLLSFRLHLGLRRGWGRTTHLDLSMCVGGLFILSSLGYDFCGANGIAKITCSPLMHVR